jgi:hypothetical protein
MNNNQAKAKPAAKVKILARLSVQQFAGYCLFGVELKARSQRSWQGAVQHFGRTDTIEQALGRAAEYVKHLPIECVRHDACYFSWKTARAVMGLHRDEYRFQEGLMEWRSFSPEQKQRYHDAGVSFLYRYREDAERRSTLISSRPSKLPAHLLAALGLESTVTSGTVIKAAYRRAVATHHPDKGGNAKRFVEVRKAYEKLAGHLGAEQC